MENALLIVTTVVVGLICAAALILGAIDLFARASEIGVKGLVLYVLCWLFLSPFIAAVSLLVGIYVLYQIIVLIYTKRAPS
ncbi:hypothetical protein [Alteromonas stellipolaris]|uniref:hypothetical protein n=1 Tax=Alteromonas stellipolaris TaxID=233316 RepID=UPI0027335790|nr:hypothetical protein [Alteromonas stellipolaris]MDP2537935.1 hypothetical protein [Alteromonas stellipolaris]